MIRSCYNYKVLKGREGKKPASSTRLRGLDHYPSRNLSSWHHQSKSENKAEELFCIIVMISREGNSGDKTEVEGVTVAGGSSSARQTTAAISAVI